MKRRHFLAFSGLAASACAIPQIAQASSATATQFTAPFRTISDATGSLDCAELKITGKLPTELKGRFYRNGPALFERAGPLRATLPTLV
jgi:all-trans-8'-apo-beta-carotenal 15,15'-oxygenase